MGWTDPNLIALRAAINDANSEAVLRGGAPGQVGGSAPKVVLPLHRLTKLMEPDETFDLWGVPLKVVQRGGVVAKLVGPLPESWLTELGAWNDETGEPV